MRRSGLAPAPMAVIRTPGGGMHAYTKAAGTGTGTSRGNSSTSAAPAATWSPRPAGAAAARTRSCSVSPAPPRSTGRPPASSSARSRNGSPAGHQSAVTDHATSATWPHGSPLSPKATGTQVCTGPPAARPRQGTRPRSATSPARRGPQASMTARSTAPSRRRRRPPPAAPNALLSTRGGRSQSRPPSPGRSRPRPSQTAVTSSAVSTWVGTSRPCSAAHPSGSDSWPRSSEPQMLECGF